MSSSPTPPAGYRLAERGESYDGPVLIKYSDPPQEWRPWSFPTLMPTDSIAFGAVFAIPLPSHAVPRIASVTS